MTGHDSHLMTVLRPPQTTVRCRPSESIDVRTFANPNGSINQNKKRNRVTLEMSRISSRTFSGFYRLTLRSHNKEKTGLNKLTFNLF